MNARAIFVLGTHHRYQRPSTVGAEEFAGVVTAACKDHAVQSLVEEMSAEALAQAREPESVCQRVARALSVHHLFCDLTNAERLRFGVRDENLLRSDGFLRNWTETEIERQVRASHEIRERHWLARILESDRWPTLFICGANHVGPFTQALHGANVNTILLAGEWTPNPVLQPTTSGGG